MINYEFREGNKKDSSAQEAMEVQGLEHIYLHHGRRSKLLMKSPIQLMGLTSSCTHYGKALYLSIKVKEVTESVFLL